MTGTVWPVDAVDSAPEYTGRMLRQAVGALWGGKTADRPLGARSGVIGYVDDALVTMDGTTWVVGQHPGVLDVETAAEAGPYVYSFDDDADLTGTITAADATNPRVDILYVQLSDPAESDGTAAPSVAVGYLAGTPASSPSAPATPDRSMLLAQIAVPKSSGGNPTVTQAYPFAVPFGAPIPVRSSTERDALTAYTGLQVMRIDLDGVLDQYNGTVWVAGDTGWKTLGLIGGDYTGIGTKYRIKNGVPGFQGLIQKNTGNYNANATTLLIAAGNLPTAVTPKAKINVPVSGASPDGSYRGIIDVDRSLSIVAGATPGNYVDLAGFGAIFND